MTPVENESFPADLDSDIAVLVKNGWTIETEWFAIAPAGHVVVAMRNEWWMSFHNVDATGDLANGALRRIIDDRPRGLLQVNRQEMRLIATMTDESIAHAWDARENGKEK